MNPFKHKLFLVLDSSYFMSYFHGNYKSNESFLGVFPELFKAATASSWTKRNDREKIHTPPLLHKVLNENYLGTGNLTKGRLDFESVMTPPWVCSRN